MRHRRLAREEAAKNLAERGEKPLDSCDNNAAQPVDTPAVSSALDVLRSQADPFVAPGHPQSCADFEDDPQFDGIEEAEAYRKEAKLNPSLASVASAADGNETAGVTVPRLMHRLRTDIDHGVWVPTLARRITANGDETLVLSQVLYWFDTDRRGQPRARARKKGRIWLYKTHEELAEETGLTPRRVKQCVHSLKHKGYIEIDHFLVNGLRTTHVSINADIVHQAMNDVYLRRKNAGQTDSVPRSDRIRPTGQTDSVPPVRPNPSDL